MLSAAVQENQDRDNTNHFDGRTAKGMLESLDAAMAEMMSDADFRKALESPEVRWHDRVEDGILKTCACGKVWHGVPADATLTANGDAFDGHYWNCVCNSTLFVPAAVAA